MAIRLYSAAASATLFFHLLFILWVCCLGSLETGPRISASWGCGRARLQPCREGANVEVRRRQGATSTNRRNLVDLGNVAAKQSQLEPLVTAERLPDVIINHFT
jgi:hypothetical protein